MKVRSFRRVALAAVLLLAVIASPAAAQEAEYPPPPPPTQPDTEVDGEVEVAPVDEDVDPDPDTDVGGVTIEQEEAVGATPTQVLGVSLVRTGADSLVLAVVGLGLLGLGFLAIRRTRESHS